MFGVSYSSSQPEQNFLANGGGGAAPQDREFLDGAQWFGRNSFRIAARCCDEVMEATAQCRAMIVSSSHDANEARSQTKEYLETVDGAVHRCVDRTQKLLDRSVGLSAAVAVSANWQVVVYWENDPHARFI